MALYIISTVIILGIAIYVILLYKGKIKDADKDFIPDGIEDKAFEIKAEIKERTRRVKQEVNDVGRAARELTKQLSDVPKAAGKRKGRKPQK